MSPWTPGSGIELYWGDFFDCEPDWYWSVRDLPDQDLWYVVDGNGWIASGTQRTPIGTGDCVLLRPGASYEAGHDPERPLRLIAIHFDLLRPDGSRLQLSADELLAFKRQMEHGGLFRELLTRAIHSHRDGQREWASAWLQAALMEVNRQDLRTWPRGHLGEQVQRMERMCERIRRHPEQPVRVGELAAELHVSPEHFSRLFRRLQGMSPRAFVTRTRVEAAQALLLTSSHSISRIAEILGYESPFYFSRHFKERVGVAPSAFRRGDRKPRVASP